MIRTQFPNCDLSHPIWFTGTSASVAGAYDATTPLSGTAPPLPPDKRLAAAYKLNYDVLAVIFTWASTDWNEAALTLSVVCRQWRYTAFSTPQIWSRIDLGISTTPSNLRMVLERSKPLPLHIVIPASASEMQLEVLSLVTDRIVCMRIVDHFHFLRNQFPILERLRLDHIQWTWTFDLQCLSEVSRFPELREFSMYARSSYDDHRMAWWPRFARLQQLEIPRWVATHVFEKNPGLSSVLVSLVLNIQGGAPGRLPSFPQLRHLRVTRDSDICQLKLNLDAPRLQSIESVFRKYSVYAWDGCLIRLRNPRSVKQLRLMADNFDLSAYPALRRLWIDGNLHLNDKMLRSLGGRIGSCPELETIMYCHPFPEANRIFRAISNVVRKTGRDIDVREILPNEWDLPGDVQCSKGCLRSQYHE